MAKSKKASNGNGANLGFEEKLWAAADKLHGYMDAAEYKHVVLGLVFLKYISDAFQELHDTLAADKDWDPEDRDEYLAENVFWVPKVARWAKLQASAKQPTIGKLIDDAMSELVTIVHPDTLRRWIRDSQQKAKKKPVKKGRPRTQEQIRELILKLARENDWGYTRILGELRKLGVKAVSRNTVKNILKENGLDPGPKRGAGTWDEFLKIHAATLWQCDFYSKKVMTLKGLRDLYLLIFLHVETRRVFITPATYHPNEAWVKEQAEAFLKHTKETGPGTALAMHDRDTKFTASFDDVLKAGDVKVHKAAHRSPNTCAFVERFIQTLQQECLDYFVVFGEKHMNHLVSEMVAHYHEERPHQAKENDPLIRASSEPPEKKSKGRKASAPPLDAVPIGDIECRQRLGGLLKHYSRKAA